MKKFTAFLFAFLAALSLASPCDAASPVRFHVRSVTITNGSAVVEGELLNEKNFPVRIGDVEVIAKITNLNGDDLMDDTYQFSDIGVVIPADDVDTCTFTLPKADLPAYDGRFLWRIQSRLKWTEA